MECPLLMAAVIIAKANAQFTEDTARGLTACGDWCPWWVVRDTGKVLKECCAFVAVAEALEELVNYHTNQ